MLLLSFWTCNCIDFVIQHPIVVWLLRLNALLRFVPYCSFNPTDPAIIALVYKAINEFFVQ